MLSSKRAARGGKSEGRSGDKQFNGNAAQDRKKQTAALLVRILELMIMWVRLCVYYNKVCHSVEFEKGLC